MMQSRLIYASTLDGSHAALFINGAVVLAQSHADQKDHVSRTAERIARALQVTLYSCVVTPPADWSGNWQDLHAEVEKRAPAAESAGAPNLVDVRHWNCYVHQEGPDEPYVNTHQFEFDDHRTTSGQARLVLASRDNDLADDLLDVLVEVNTNPLDGVAHVQCAHVHIDCDEQLVSLFKIGDKLLVRPNTGVRFVSDSVEINGQRESVLWIE